MRLLVIIVLLGIVLATGLISNFLEWRDPRYTCIKRDTRIEKWVPVYTLWLWDIQLPSYTGGCEKQIDRKTGEPKPESVDDSDSEPNTPESTREKSASPELNRHYTV